VLSRAFALVPRTALAGAQKYEPLAMPCAWRLPGRSPTAAAERPFTSIDDRLAYLAWMRRDVGALKDASPTTARESNFSRHSIRVARAGLDRQLVLGLIQVESNFRKYAVSVAGARGYMQVMPFWTRVIGDGEPRRLFEMRANLRYGSVILRHYLDMEKGDLFLALAATTAAGRPQYRTPCSPPGRAAAL